MISIDWEHPTEPVLKDARFRVCKLSNGETVGAMAFSTHTGKWSATQTHERTYDTEEEAKAALMEKANARIWFLGK